MTIETKNATITSTMLGVEDHGILTCFVYLDYGGSSQGFGGYAFDQYDEKTRVGWAGAGTFLRRLLDTVGVDRWEKLPRTNVRVKAEWGKVHSIGHIVKDQWFTPDELCRELK